jgi:hypothetical protein
MAQLDIKKCTVRIVDGRRATHDIGAGNAGVRYTALSKHRGTRQDLLVAHVQAGLNTPLTVAVATSNSTGKTTITVNLATNGAGAITSTAEQVRAAVAANVTAAALVTPTNVGDGTGTAVAAAAAAINTSPARSVTVKVGNGTLNFSEQKQIEYTLDRGNIDTTREGDEVPMDVDVDMTWEFLTAVAASGSPTPIDAIKGTGEAAAWTSTSDDPSGCSPYCVDIEVEYNPGSCGNELREFYVFEEFYWSDLNPAWRDGTIKFRGQCNRIAPSIYRVAA